MLLIDVDWMLVVDVFCDFEELLVFVLVLVGVVIFVLVVSVVLVFVVVLGENVLVGIDSLIMSVFIKVIVLRERNLEMIW